MLNKGALIARFIKNCSVLKMFRTMNFLSINFNISVSGPLKSIFCAFLNNQNFRALRALNSSSCRGLARFAHQRSRYAQPHLGASPPQLHLHLFGSQLNFFGLGPKKIKTLKNVLINFLAINPLLLRGLPPRQPLPPNSYCP